MGVATPSVRSRRKRSGSDARTSANVRNWTAGRLWEEQNFAKIMAAISGMGEPEGHR
jgi:hypothetical protein